MREMPAHAGSKVGTPEEMTELTEHLRRHTSRAIGICCCFQPPGGAAVNI